MKALLLMGAYAVGALLTFGYTYNELYVEPPAIVDCGVKPDILKDNRGNLAWYVCERSNISAKYPGPESWRFLVGFVSSYKAIAWPVYWPARLSIEVFE